MEGTQGGMVTTSILPKMTRNVNRYLCVPTLALAQGGKHSIGYNKMNRICEKTRSKRQMSLLELCENLVVWYHIVINIKNSFLKIRIKMEEKIFPGVVFIGSTY